MRPLRGHAEGDSVSYAEFSPDGSQILTSGWTNKATKVWDARTATEQFTLEGGTNSHPARLFGRDGTQILTLAGAGMFVGSNMTMNVSASVIQNNTATTGSGAGIC